MGTDFQKIAEYKARLLALGRQRKLLEFKAEPLISIKNEVGCLLVNQILSENLISLSKLSVIKPKNTKENIKNTYLWLESECATDLVVDLKAIVKDELMTDIDEPITALRFTVLADSGEETAEKTNVYDFLVYSENSLNKVEPLIDFTLNSNKLKLIAITDKDIKYFDTDDIPELESRFNTEVLPSIVQLFTLSSNLESLHPEHRNQFSNFSKILSLRESMTKLECENLAKNLTVIDLQKAYTEKILFSVAHLNSLLSTLTLGENVIYLQSLNSEVIKKCIIFFELDNVSLIDYRFLLMTITDALSYFKQSDFFEYADSFSFKSGTHYKKEYLEFYDEFEKYTSKRNLLEKNWLKTPKYLDADILKLSELKSFCEKPTLFKLATGLTDKSKQFKEEIALNFKIESNTKLQAVLSDLMELQVEKGLLFKKIAKFKQGYGILFNNLEEAKQSLTSVYQAYIKIEELIKNTKNALKLAESSTYIEDTLYTVFDNLSKTVLLEYHPVLAGLTLLLNTQNDLNNSTEFKDSIAIPPIIFNYVNVALNTTMKSFTSLESLKKEGTQIKSNLSCLRDDLKLLLEYAKKVQAISSNSEKRIIKNIGYDPTLFNETLDLVTELYKNIQVLNGTLNWFKIKSSSYPRNFN